MNDIEPSGIVPLKERFRVNLGMPLPEFDTPNARAFACEDRRASGGPVYALVVTGPLPPRIATANIIQGLEISGLVQLLEWGVIDFAPGKARAVAFVYERPLGGRVMPTMTSVFDPLSERDFMRGVVRPLVEVMDHFAGKGVVHRAIRPTNFFWMDKERTRIALGDCVSGPPAYNQPAICEPIESAMANPEGRGPGQQHADLYAMGVSLAALSTGRLSQARLSDRDILTQKINAGSYATVVGEARIPLEMIEVVRGLLMDDVKRRWKLEDVEAWSQGRRGKPMTDSQERRSHRPFSFKEKEYLTARSLAHALAENWDDALDPVFGGKVELWVRRGLEQAETADAILKEISYLSGRDGDPASARDFAMGRILSLLDPRAPLRIRNYRFHAEAIGVAFACTLAVKGDIRLYVDVIRRSYLNRWIEGQGELSGVELVRLESHFKDLRAFLVDTSKGGGIERVLYEANPSLGCQSPLVRDQCVLDIRDLLPALEQIADKGEAAQSPVDRHIVAFVAARFGADTEPQIRALNASSAKEQALGVLSLLGVLQWKLGPDALPKLAAWLSRMMSPVLESYHSRDRRKAIERELPSLVKKGSLPRLYHFLDNSAERQKDYEGFMEAEKEYAQITRRVEDLEAGNYTASDEAQKKGQQAAAIVAVAVAFVSMILTVLSYL
ncbi:protein kinase family protein [Phaeovibrio sulfidiphilus]|uniref:Protein kinase family protein n=1 Tax=Phaeovibrio sulfidiphilus TaxID=1220600 RepID=A0A8J6YTM5_9PROT|nr:protein kinase family protein [Phaeovibrio sulfidiphilus]